MLVGLGSPDDAGVYRLGPDLALVVTVDYFTPVVDDPFLYGQIAAANSLSDVYAMGGRPVTALNIVGFPISRLPHQVLAEILRGGAEKVQEAGAVLIGGHSLDDQEPKYGLAVTGIVHPDRVITKGGARPGDRLILTKPIGSGVVTTAGKKDVVPAEALQEATRVMAALNNQVGAMQEAGVRGATDVTGFGLLGHAREMAREAGVGIRLRASAVPVLPFAREAGERGFFPGGSKANHRYLQNVVDYADGLSEADRLLLCDAVTSGGLLIAVAPDRAEQLRARLVAQGALLAAEIGEVVEGPAGRIRVEE